MKIKMVQTKPKMIDLCTVNNNNVYESEAKKIDIKSAITKPIKLLCLSKTIK